MGAALYIVAGREMPGLNVGVDGKALSRAEEVLDRLATEAGVTPLMEFYSIEPEEAEAFFEVHGNELPEGGFPPVQWFAAADGLATVRALIARLRSDPAGLANSEAVLEDLGEFEAVLGRLDAAGIPWHLAVDI